MKEHKVKKDRTIIISYILLIFFTLLFIYQNIQGLGFLNFTDESGHFLGAQAIHHGDRLYGDYIDAHGPLVFILSWLTGQIVGFSEVWLFRLTSTFCAIAAALAIFFSPFLQAFWQRSLATSLWLGIISSVWIIQGLYLDSYWTIGGCLATIGLATLGIPLVYGYKISKIQSFIGGISIGLLPCAAYSFGLMALALCLILLLSILVDFKKYYLNLIMTLSGICFATISIFIWLLIYGDIGGMIAFHFIANQRDYAHYLPFNFINFCRSLIPLFTSHFIIHVIAIFLFSIGAVLLFLTGAYKLRAIILVLGVISFQLRGSLYFQDGSFLIASVALFTFLIIQITKSKPKIAIITTFFLIAIIAFVSNQYAVTSPAEYNKQQRYAYHWHPFKKSNDEISKIIRFYTYQNERILTVPYGPDIYIQADRLPMKKYHGYLPWEADYAKHPWHGYERDLCKDLPKNEPPIIYYDHWVVWDQYPPEQFMRCVLDILKKDYTRFSSTSFIYIRNDRFNEKKSK